MHEGEHRFRRVLDEMRWLCFRCLLLHCPVFVLITNRRWLRYRESSRDCLRARRHATPFRGQRVLWPLGNEPGKGGRRLLKEQAGGYASSRSMSSGASGSATASAAAAAGAAAPCSAAVAGLLTAARDCFST